MSAVDRGDAVNLARELSEKDILNVTPHGIRVLVDAVLKMDAAMKEQCGPAGPVYVGAWGPEQIAAMADCRPGDIQVVYPLNEEWNAAIDASIEVARNMTDYQYDEVGIEPYLRELKRQCATEDSSK